MCSSCFTAVGYTHVVEIVAFDNDIADDLLCTLPLTDVHEILEDQGNIPLWTERLFEYLDDDDDVSKKRSDV